MVVLSEDPLFAMKAIFLVQPVAASAVASAALRSNDICPPRVAFAALMSTLGA